MFSKKIVDTDAFLDMPQTSQLLYFHLNMYADDEGFVGNPKKIMRMLGFGDDDMKVLVGKRFVLVFESGVVVIKHWLIHNTIQADRQHPTTYLEEKNGLKIKENKSYTECIQNVSKMETQIRLDKTRLDLDKIRLSSEQGSQINPLIKLFKSVNPSYEKFYSNKTQRSALQRMVDKYGEEKVRGFISYLPIINEDKYAKGKSITPLQLEDNLAHLVNHFKQKQGEGFIKI